MQKRPFFVLPEWVDLIVALAGGGLMWLWIDSLVRPTDLLVIVAALAIKLVVVAVTYVLILVIVRVLMEPTRLYRQGLAKYNQNIRPPLRDLQQGIEALRRKSPEDAESLQKAITITDGQIVRELFEQGGIAFYQGMSQLQPKVDQLAQLINGHMLLLENPSLVRSEYEQKLAVNRAGLRGYLDYALDLSQRVHSKEIFNMTTGARMLQALQHVIPQTETKYEPKTDRPTDFAADRDRRGDADSSGDFKHSVESAASHADSDSSTLRHD